MTPADFGLEALYKLQPITSKQDALTLLVHFVLSKNGWQYFGRGDRWLPDESPSESLPAGWAGTGDPFRYLSRSDPPKKFTIKFVPHEQFLLVNMISVADDSSLSMSINMTKEVEEKELASNVPKKVYPNLINLIGNIYDQLVRPCEVSSRSVGVMAKEQAPSNAGPRRSQEPGPHAPENRPGSGGYRHPPELPRELPLGRRDLDPFAPPGVGGGMIFDPLRVDRRDPRWNPLGPDGQPLAPPGARYDPIGPGEPDPDDFIPPGMRRGGRRGGGPGGWGGGFGGEFGGGGGFGGGGFGGGFL